MKKLLSIIGTLNLTVVPAISTMSCSLFGGDKNDDKTDNEAEDADDLNIPQAEEEAVESAIKSVDDTVILTKLEGGIDANGRLTPNSTFTDAIEFLQEEVQQIDSNASVESNEENKLNDNLTVGDNTISVKFKQNSDSEEETINAIITNVTKQEPRSGSVFENLIKSIFEDGVSGAHLSTANEHKDILPIINEKLDDIDDEIEVSIEQVHENEKLKAGDNTIKIKFEDENNNVSNFSVIVKNVQSTGFIGKLRDQYPDGAIFQIADHMAEAFGIQKLDKFYNLSALSLLKKANTAIKSTGHYIIDKIKYKEKYGSEPEEDINESRKQAKEDKKTTGFLAKIKNKLKFKKSNSDSKSSNFYSANSASEEPNTIEIPVTDPKDHSSDTFKIKLQAKSVPETDKEAKQLIKLILSSPIDGKTLNTNEKISAIIPLVKAKINTLSGLHQWHIDFKDKKIAKKNLSETNKIEFIFSRPNSVSNFTSSVTVNKVKKVDSELNLNFLPQRIDVALWGITTSSTWDHLIKNITLSLKLNTAKYKIEIVSKKLKSKLTAQDNNKKFNLKISPKKGKATTASITLFNIKPGKEKTTVFDKLYKKTQQISKKIGKNFDVVKNKLFNKNSDTSHSTNSKTKNPQIQKTKNPQLQKIKNPQLQKIKNNW